MKKYIVIIDLHCDPTIPSGAGDIGGGNTYSRSLLHELQKNNVPHIYITRKKYPHLEEYIHMTPCSEFYRIDLGDWGPIDKDILQNYHLQSEEKINNILSNYKNDQFIFHSSYWQSGMLAYSLSEKYHTFYVHTILSNAKKKQLIGAVDDIAKQRIEEEEKIFSHAKYLICSSLSEINEMQNLYAIPLEKLIMAGLKVDSHYLFPAYNARGEIHINTLGINAVEHQYLSYFTESNENDNYLWWNEKNFIYFGRIHKNKGIKEIIIAWSQAYQLIGISMPNLWIVGGAPTQIEHFRNEIKEDIPLLESYEKQHKIIWWGTLPPEGISTLLLKSSVLITHSKYEAGGLVLLEALNQGIPVIATPNGYGKDYLKDWYNGFVVPYNDIASLRQKLIFFCSQPFLSDYMGRNAKHSATMIEQSYNFFHSHMFAYGLDDKCNHVLPTHDNIDWYQEIRRQPMDSYPFLTNFPSIKDIIQIIKSCTQCTVLKIVEVDEDILDYKLWEITTNYGNYLFAYYYDIINTTNIWNPYSTEEYVLTKAKRVNTVVDLFAEMKNPSVVYKNTAYGYVIYKGSLSDVFLPEEYLHLSFKSEEEEAILINYKFNEILELLKSPFMKQYNVLSLIHYVERIKSNFKSNTISEVNIPFVSITPLFLFKENLKILSYDKIGLKYKHLQNASREVNDISVIANCNNLDLEHLWSIYFELYAYIEQQLVYSKDFKTTFIDAIQKGTLQK